MRVMRDRWSTLRGNGPKPESPGTACQTRGPLDTSTRCPGQVFDIAGPQKLARDDRERWLKPQDIGARSKSSGTLVEPAGSQTRV